MSGKRYSPEELKEVIDLHAKWTRDEDGGKRADLSNSDLVRANMAGAYMVRAAGLS